ncbi:MAG TPA: hypothetical protein VEL74_09740 [Thermoanaerobaculia bacterium]|nr:hypothetical protein [Thermoanaerobaculia bacterium]
MDDSERSYGYSEDIYHGKKPGEESYEYGPEPEGLDGNVNEEVSPEEAAMHIEDRGLATGRGEESPLDAGDTDGTGGTYDYDRSGASGNVESFTWSQPDSEAKEEELAETTVQSRP